MRLGYAISTSETILAEHAEYGDCAKFQITCPCCREAVFKGKRVRPGEVHYFSHYRGDSEEARRCEMRVAAMVKAHAPVLIMESHGQTLQAFMAVFRESVIKAQSDMGIVPYATLRGDIYRILARPDILEWTAPLRKLATLPLFPHAGQIEPGSREGMATDLSRMPPYASRSPFWHRRQASYALDVASHLMTEQATDNFNFIAAAVYSVLFRNPTAYPPFDNKPINPFAKSLVAALCEGRSTGFIRKTCLEHVEMIRRRPKPVIKIQSGMTVLEEVIAGLGHQRDRPRQETRIVSSILDTALPVETYSAGMDLRKDYLDKKLSELDKELNTMEDDLWPQVREIALMTLVPESVSPFWGLLAGASYTEGHTHEPRS